jgi:CO/xanthine dehydrogenase FAD-binding subunit
VSKLLSKYGKEAKIIAGGTDLLVERPPNIRCLIDISNLKLDYIKKCEDGIKIGAATVLNHIENSSVLTPKPYDILIQAINMMATPTIRNMGTIGGNICNASPASDMALPLMVLGCNLIISGSNGTKKLPIGEFFENVKKTVLEKDEILVEIQIPNYAKNSSAIFLKLRHHQTAIDLAIVNVAARLSLLKNVCQEASIALGAVAKTPIYAKRAEEELIGAKITSEVINRTAEMAAGESKPIDDMRATAWYRKRMVKVMVKRALEMSIGELEHGKNKNQH